MEFRFQSAYLFEAIGTFFLVLAGSGGAEMGAVLAPDAPALGLLGGTITVAAVLFIFIHLFGPTSGAHFNPAVSLAFHAIGRLSWRDLGRYIAAQSIGAILAAFAVHFMFSLPLFQLANPMNASLGQISSEMLATGALVFVIFFAIAQNSQQIPALVALFVAAGYWMTSTSIVANPAVTLARFLTDVPTTIGMPKALYFIIAQCLAAFVIAKLFTIQRSPTKLQHPQG